MISTESLVALQGVSKCYGERERTVWAVRDVSLSVAPEEFVAIMGPSGSGKSTLLNLIAGLDIPSSGDVLVEGRALSRMSDSDLARMRRRTVAYVFQFFNLMTNLTAEQNVGVPLRADGVRHAEVNERVAIALDKVGLSHRAHHYPNELSGGEMQRVAIARALATDARVILADEPTGNLDTARSEEILELLRRATERERRAVVLVTHDVRAAACGDRLITLRDGQIVDEVVAKPNPSIMPLRHVQH